MTSVNPFDDPFYMKAHATQDDEYIPATPPSQDDNFDEYIECPKPMPKGVSRLQEIELQADTSSAPCPSPRQSKRFSLGSGLNRSPSRLRDRAHFEVRTGSNGFVSFLDEDNRSVYKVLVDRSDHKIYVKDKSNEEFCVISKAMFSLHPTFNVYQKGLKIGKATQRYKPAKWKKFNYTQLETRDVFKIKGEELGNYKMKKNESGETVASIETLGRGNHHVEVDAREEDVLHVIALLVICLCG